MALRCMARAPDWLRVASGPVVVTGKVGWQQRAAGVSICTRNCTTNLRQRCTTFAARRAIEKSATLQQHCTTNLHQRCTTFDSVIRCCNQHSETPPGVMVC